METATDNSVLKIAEQLGYKSDYDGDGAKTPEEFILYSKEIEKNQRTKIKDLIGKVDTMSSEFVKTQKTFAETIDAQNLRHKSELKQAKDKLERDFDEAVDEADTVKARAIQKEIKDIEKQETAPVKTVNHDQEYFDKWREKNSWMDTDKKAQAEFKKAHIDLITEHGEGKGAEFELDYIEKKLKKKMPEKFGLKPTEEPPGGDVGEGKSADKITKQLKVSGLNAQEKELFNKQKRAFGKHFNEKSSLAAIAAVRASKGAK